MNRTMIDCTHQNLPSVLGHALGPLDMVACYVTGSPDIRWTTADKITVSQSHPLVFIDQGGQGSPVLNASIRDVEAGAWTVTAAVNRAGWNVARPTIYISRSRLGELVTAGWDGDVWMADWTGTASILPPMPPRGARFRIVAWQYVNRGTYDLSVVYDPDWPGAGPAVPTWQEAAMQQLPTIQYGATGEAVRTAQGLCNARDQFGPLLVIDGVFGFKTSEHVRQLQTAASIASDGIVGPQTWPVLLGVQ